MSIGSEKVKRKRRSGGANKRWTEAEEDQILGFLLDLAPKNLEFEKPNKKDFYKHMAEELNLAVNDFSQLINKVKNMKTLYVQAVDWKANTGKGVESGSVEDHIKRMCPYFDQLDEIFGHKSNVAPPYTYESSASQDERLVPSCDKLGQSEIYYLDSTGDFADIVESSFASDTDNRTTATDQSSETRQFKERLSMIPSNVAATAETTQEDNEKENISRFKRRLLNSPAVKDKTLPRNSTSILADAQNKKVEAILARNEIEKDRIENERLLKLGISCTRRVPI